MTKLNLAQTYDFDKINETLDKFKNIRKRNTIVSSFDGRTLCSVDVSDKYYNFDFSKFCKMIVSEISNYFTPEAYLLRVSSGIQELRLAGEEVDINGDKYLKLFSIINSTNKQRALSMNVGLIRKKNKSSSVHVSFRNKHYKSSMPDKIVSFSNNLINFNLDVEYQISTIEKLSKKEISFLDLVKNLSAKPSGKFIKSMHYKVRAFGKKLEEYGYYEINTLRNPFADNVSDFKVNAVDAHNAYIELFSNYDTTIISRETSRILTAIKSCNYNNQIKQLKIWEETE